VVFYLETVFLIPVLFLFLCVSRSGDDGASQAKKPLSLSGALSASQSKSGLLLLAESIHVQGALEAWHVLARQRPRTFPLRLFANGFVELAVDMTHECLNVCCEWFQLNVYSFFLFVCFFI
jgi:hypothetical protein